MADYEKALSVLPESKREAVILRIEFGMTYSEIAAELNLPSVGSARQKVARALLQVADLMA